MKKKNLIIGTLLGLVCISLISFGFVSYNSQQPKNNDKSAGDLCDCNKIGDTSECYTNSEGKKRKLMCKQADQGKCRWYETNEACN